MQCIWMAPSYLIRPQQVESDLRLPVRGIRCGDIETSRESNLYKEDEDFTRKAYNKPTIPGVMLVSAVSGFAIHEGIDKLQNSVKIKLHKI